VAENYATHVNKDEMAKATKVYLLYIIDLRACDSQRCGYCIEREAFLKKSPDFVDCLKRTAQGGPLVDGENINANVAYLLVIPRSMMAPTIVIEYDWIG
jgi:hypothetical protein